ncbi:Nramp family divalent metal transporter [Sphingomonas sp. AR_OL41]|uniref:Nramp family divalent metal transporter n=1 Tax=Sphingomonas sp. AR_OL41 TaxID=3042729 RepID=UPI0024804DDD|nr:Nramp family divalent metal transporter [Sphingomonas sp. AR_OL41]MDH7972373.1 Nramp family divalent metal transporter [Sphingomonas sp. AR_OL41]
MASVPRPSLAESYRSVAVPLGRGRFWAKLAAFSGPGYMVAVGYMDPGNWATDLAGGSGYGYALLSVILLSNIMAMVLQSLAARLGIGTGRDLAQACRAWYPRPVTIVLWILCEIAIIACDLAEVLGTAIALNLLFGLSLVAGVCLTGFDVLLILGLQRFGFRKLEAFIIALLVVIAGCFAYELWVARPDIAGIAQGLIPQTRIVTDPAMLYIAIGILGATVMPHNLYLHSAIVQTRASGEDDAGRRDALRHATIDSNIALSFALFINAAILILAAAAFHRSGHSDIAEIGDAYKLLTPVLGAGAASVVFAVALLASGQNSTVTGTLAGQIVAEGFLDLRLPVWLRRMATRLLAIVPAVIVVAMSGDVGATRLLVLSQVILSLQLPFAVVPLVAFTASRAKMGALVSPLWLRIAAWTIAAVVIGLNLTLLVGFL